MGLLVPRVAAGGEPVLDPAALARGLVDDHEARIGRDLHAQGLVLDDAVAGRGHSPTRPREGADAEPKGAYPREASLHVDHRVARPRKRIPDHRRIARAGKPAHELRGERCAAFLTRGEAWRHVE